jgi:hypothetical protein
VFEIKFTSRAKSDFEGLQNNAALKKRLKAVQNTIGYLQTNPRHPSLNTHKYESLNGPNGTSVFEAYAENNTSGAYRVFWYYGPGQSTITIFSITPHP